MQMFQVEKRRVRKQCGAAAVEFALIAVVFFSLLLGIIEFGRVLFTWNSAVEATRYGARVAVVCNPGSAAVVSSMQHIMPGITTDNVVVIYEPDGCNQASCDRVKVRVQDITLTPMIPLLGLTLNVPEFETSLMRESLDSTLNSACS